MKVETQSRPLKVRALRAIAYVPIAIFSAAAIGLILYAFLNLFKAMSHYFNFPLYWFFVGVALFIFLLWAIRYLDETN